MYGMKVLYNDQDEITDHFYPVYKEGSDAPTGYFKRTLPKQFSAVGDVKDCKLQGQELFERGGKYENQAGKKFIVVTEGFLDALAAQQMLSENNPNYMTAVVSLPNGINSKSIKQNYKFLNEYESVLFCVDQDDAGRKGAKEACKCLPMGKAKIMSFSKKDPCDMLKAGLNKEFGKAFWQAESYSPSGIVDSAGLWGVLTSKDDNNAVPYPWEGLNKLTGGIRTSEMVTLTAGSGIAKSSLARAILHNLIKTTDANIGGMFLEENVKRTGLSIMSYEAEKLLHLPDTQYTEQEFKQAFDSTLGTGRVFLFDNFGSTDIDTIIENITYFARAANCKYVFLDHISIMVSSGVQNDERKALDEICTKLRTLVQELDIALIIISHLKRPSGDLGHEQGATTSLAQLRGSAAIAQLSDMVIGIERNQQHDDLLERNTSTLRVLKNRFSGMTGVATRVLYNNVTGKIVERNEIEGEGSLDEFIMDDVELEEPFQENDLPWDVRTPD
jgi:twinkle protein